VGISIIEGSDVPHACHWAVSRASSHDGRTHRSMPHAPYSSHSSARSWPIDRGRKRNARIISDQGMHVLGMEPRQSGSRGRWTSDHSHAIVSVCTMVSGRRETMGRRWHRWHSLGQDLSEIRHLIRSQSHLGHLAAGIPYPPLAVFPIHDSVRGDRLHLSWRKLRVEREEDSAGSEGAVGRDRYGRRGTRSGLKYVVVSYRGTLHPLSRGQHYLSLSKYTNSTGTYGSQP
jgi:hypothetical protein